MNKTFFDKNTINIIVLSLVSFIEALQVLIIIVFIFSFIPIAVPPLVQKLYPLSVYDVHLKRDILFYHVWIALGLGLQGSLMFATRRHLGEDHWWRGLCPYICTMAVFVTIQIFAVFKILLLGNLWWSRDVFYAFLGAGILARIFWPELQRSIDRLWTLWTTRTVPWGGFLLMDAGAIFILVVLVFTPNLSEVLARMFSYDKFYHLDSFIMSPAWAHHNGLILNKDVTSEYSLIIPIVFDALMKLAGGFSYAHAVGLMIGMCAMYYFFLYGLWRYWTGSFWLAFFAVVVSIKLQFFHWGVVPLIWVYPSATPLRSLPDVFFLFFILRFTQNLSLRWLFAAALASGVGLVWTLDVGVYLFVTLLIAALGMVYIKGTKFVPKVLPLVLLPWVVALGILSIFYGTLIWDPHFWQRDFEFASLFLQGWGALPITDGLKDKQFFAFCMGFMVPIAYMGTLLYSLGIFLFRKSRPHLFMILICIYGLGLYHYFIHRSAVTSYYAVVVPLIFVLLYWLQVLLGCCRENWQKGIKLFLCVWALTALTTGFLYLYYPNFLNLSAYDWSGEKKFYEEEFDFSQDALLIDSLTAPNEPVAVITSFETKILMQANRRPFFYYFPMMESQHMRADQETGWRNLYLHTYARLQQTLTQLQEQKPTHIFIETRLIKGPQAQSYEDSHEGFKVLMAYIRQHYQYPFQGQYLTALELK
jgi:hypothetical protein